MLMGDSLHSFIARDQWIKYAPWNINTFNPLIMKRRKIEKKVNWTRDSGFREEESRMFSLAEEFLLQSSQTSENFCFVFYFSHTFLRFLHSFYYHITSACFVKGANKPSDNALGMHALHTHQWAICCFCFPIAVFQGKRNRVHSM